MIRVVVILLLLSSPLLAQGVSFGVHGCGSWLKGEFTSGGFSYESVDYETIYGLGVDVVYNPPLLPLGIEAGFTYLSKSDTESNVVFEAKGHPLYLNGKFYFGPFTYVGAGINYTLWDVSVDGKEHDVDNKLGFQGGIGAELGSKDLKIYGSAFYFIQKGEMQVDDDIELQVDGAFDVELKGLQIRAGIRFGG